jgi:ABC-type phosphate transport system substrate-binding protein
MSPPLHRILLCVLLPAWLWTGAGPAGAAEGIAVIVARNAPQTTMDRATLRDIYLKKVFVDPQGNALVPVNLPADNALRRAFSRELLREDAEALQSYWNERYFHGIRPPYVLGSQRAVLRFVAGTEGAIGYVASCRVDADVRVLARLPVPSAERGALREACKPPRR